ncbi:hypothetical protein [Acidovorax sp.]|uniref:hypothetical protein n=1 Tax=Acidovorax sp. TaxID=1872122 RepID=UPI0025C0DE4F|nr:hypothetical protein [Acidovorax sp.]MBW8463381.1 hypothetical protein [Acidovorax sp.]
MSVINVGVLTALGQPEYATPVQELLTNFALTERLDDPPLRHYLVSRTNGLSFLFEDGLLLDIQVFVQHTKLFAACPFELPFGLRQEMNQIQVHQLLGEPISCDAFDSRYVLSGHDARLLIGHETNGGIRYLSFEGIQTAAL